jgi:hypothetical protein
LGERSERRVIGWISFIEGLRVNSILPGRVERGGKEAENLQLSHTISWIRLAVHRFEKTFLHFLGLLWVFRTTKVLGCDAVDMNEVELIIQVNLHFRFGVFLLLAEHEAAPFPDVGERGGRLLGEEASVVFEDILFRVWV